MVIECTEGPKKWQFTVNIFWCIFLKEKLLSLHRILVWVLTTCIYNAFVSWVSLKMESCHNANFAITGSITGCHNDNLQCQQWRQSWHHDNCWLSEILQLLFVYSWNLYNIWCILFCLNFYLSLHLNYSKYTFRLGIRQLSILVYSSPVRWRWFDHGKQRSLTQWGRDKMTAIV